MMPNFWRAPTDNDSLGGKRNPLPQAPWRDAMKTAQLLGFDTKQINPKQIELSARYDLATAKAKLQVTYVVRGSGRLQVDLDLQRDDDSPLLPRFGMQLGLASLNKATYFGRGPHENYWDRKSGAALGIYHSPLPALTYTYGRPQENGNRSDCRWAKFQIGRLPFLKITGKPTFDFTAWPYTMNTLEAAKHTTDLPPAGYTTVCIDYRQMGVGGDDTWSDHAMPLKKYQLNERHLQYGFTLEALATTKAAQKAEANKQ